MRHQTGNRPVVNPKPPAPTIDTTNVQLVSVGAGNEIIVGIPRTRMSREETLVHAAYLVLLADPAGTQFQHYLEAVQST